MESTVEAPVNSRQWWEAYYANQWDAECRREHAAHFMRRLIENLPPAERDYLSSRETTVLDWGCAMGDGVNALAEEFPRARVAGLDFVERAVAEARRRFPKNEFHHTPDGSVEGRFDVITAVACLEHFADPLEVMRGHLRSCRGYYAVMVPFRESPLDFGHLSQFREECFPDRLDGFTRIVARVTDCEFRRKRGKWMLVVYASPAYARDRDNRDLQLCEREKWDDYYATLPMLDIDDAMRDFGDDLAERIGELLPQGGRVLEAGCGAGLQSLALAQKELFDISLMDFSAEALSYARRIFDQHQRSAQFVEGDVFARGEPQYDMVFNAGVLEHYTFEQQVAFLQGMASRSTKYVLALVPNKACYWYWLWRMHRSARNGWPFGKEMPTVDLSPAFEAAGLQFLGHWFGGASWSEFFITDISGIDDRLRDEILAVHRSQVVPGKQRAYLVAALGCKGNAPAVPSCWDTTSGSDNFTLDQLTASLADSLAATVASNHRCKQMETQLAEKNKLLTAEQAISKVLREQLRGHCEVTDRLNQIAIEGDLAAAVDELTALKKTRGFQGLLWFWRMKSKLTPPGGRRARLARMILHTPVAIVKPLLRTPRAVWRLGERLVPEGTLRDRCAQAAAQNVRRLWRRPACQQGVELAEALERNADRRGVVIYPPFIDWGWMRQRPHQLMAQFAEAGYLSLFCSPQRRTDSFKGCVRVAERLYLCDNIDSLAGLQNPILLVNRTSHWNTVKRFDSPLVIYDYLDDLSVSSRGGAPNRHKLELHRKLTTRSDIVLATARRLHDEVRLLRPDALYCPNGVDFDHFCLSFPPAAPADIADLVQAGRPIVGYYGALARWFDYELLAQTARLRGDVNFLLIGPDFDGSMTSGNMAGLPNVRWLGEKKYEELPAYLHHFTVAAIPFVVNEITASTSPVKLFEYMAAGKPVVTTDMPECRQCPDVLVAGDAHEFAAMIDEAVRCGRSDSFRGKLIEQARANTWRRRAELIIERLDAVGRKRRSA